MDWLIISLVTFIGAGLTLFSGFGLGTLLLPVFGIFFPIDIAIGLTAIVHFSNNLIKLGFFYKHLDWRIITRFGMPSIFSAFLGAYLLTTLTNLKPILSYTIFDSSFVITPIKLTIALLLIIFSMIEFLPKLSDLQFDIKYMPIGGLLSGFFGGLSGNQGALRTTFLIRARLSKEVFIGTGVVIACFVDITRLSIYSQSIFDQIDESKITILIIAAISAFTGVFIGNKLIKKMTIKTLHVFVAIMILIFAILLGFGLI